MVNVDESYSSVGGLEFMVFAIGGEIDVCALGYCFVNELRSASSAEGYGLYHLLGRTRVAHVRTF